MNKKIILIIYLFLSSCGFKPMYKNIDINKINIQKINYSGNNNLIYQVKTYLNINESNNPNGFKINVFINENVSATSKNSSGIVVEEEITINIRVEIYNFKDEFVSQEIFNSSKKIQISNNTSSDEELKNIEKNNLIQNLSQKIKFKIQLLTQKI